jgi:hypothetical protein
LENKYDYIIIGGGPAGIMSAIWAASNGVKTAILEKKDKLGRKILISGSGQCNVTNAGSISDFLTKYGKNSRFLKNSLYNFSPSAFFSFLTDNGLNLYTREDGKIFPESKKAGDVLSLLYDLCRKNNVDILVSQEVISISMGELHSSIFTIKTINSTYTSQNILIATGGITYQHTGSTGDGYKFAEEFGHTIIEPRPSLSPIFIENYQFNEISGVSFKDIEVTVLNENNKKIATLKNDLLLTHRNLSGPVILNISRYAKVGHYLQINFVNKSKDQVREEFLLQQTTNGKKLLKNYLKVYTLPSRFILKVMDIINIDENIKISDINKKMRESLLTMLTEYKNKIFKIAPSGMTTVGGINLKEINPKTMESKLVSGLYFAGEVLDIDGDTGGYSIQAASSMAVLAAKDIVQKHNL